MVFLGHIVKDIYCDDPAVGLFPRLAHFVRDTAVEDGILGTFGGQFLGFLFLFLFLFILHS